ncbi:hypothetical protein VB816_13105 [Limnoraphis robusta CCNP1324]|uniref:hypothetical protein n=1 Tax=Limnoraphis robusta TaxID=1118279 RepID=UPI002B1F4FF9|nr:hypothetical protein [Limnoraphis robusta]MEA5545919.1 hypothetical protein [Limnoraphis robusta CCNP1324]
MTRMMIVVLFVYFLWGVGGTDVLDGGGGDDFIRGGSGADTFVFRLGDGADVVEFFDVASDRIALRGVAEEDLSFWDDGSGTEIYTADGTCLWMIGVTGVTPDQFTFA